jgi:hypothetical protein
MVNAGGISHPLNPSPCLADNSLPTLIHKWPETHRPMDDSIHEWQETRHTFLRPQQDHLLWHNFP